MLLPTTESTAMILKAGDLKKSSDTASTVHWRSKHGHLLAWSRVDNRVSLQTTDGEWHQLEPAATAVEAKQRYVNFRESDQ